MKRTKDEYVRAITAAKGFVTVAAQALGVSVKAVYSAAERHPEVREALEMAREQMLDIAEGALYKNIQAGDNTAIIFFLKTQGKKRGYIERQELHHSGDIVINFDGKPVRE